MRNPPTYLSQRVPSFPLVPGVRFYPFDCHLAVRLGVHGRDDHAIAALADDGRRLDVRLHVKENIYKCQRKVGQIIDSGWEE